MKKRILYIASVILILLVVILFRFQTTKEPTIDELLFEVPEMEEGLSRNEKIKFSFDSFISFAKKTNSPENLCKGGFINFDSNKLKKIADEIVSNRVISPYPLEFASNQDEAGITCLSDKKKWVLFSPLNKEDESELNYLCADYTGRKGNFSLDRENVKCGN